MWSPEEAHFHDCRKRLLGNEEWGKSIAPMVDKIGAKTFAHQSSPTAHIVPTLSSFDSNNISLLTPDFLRRLPQPFVIKPTHISGWVMGVVNDTYQCLKACQITGSFDDDGHALSLIQLAKNALNSDYSASFKEMQYHTITPRIIVERYLPLHEMRDVTYWYIAHGVPVFVSMECSAPSNRSDHEDRIFLTADYHPLPITLSKNSCGFFPPRPRTWERMRRIAEKELGPGIPGVVRLDLYASETDVYFSEFTFTTLACGYDFSPRIADGLLYAIDHGILPASVVTPAFVRDTILDSSWVHIPSGQQNAQLDFNASSAFPSPVDLCQAACGTIEGKQCYAACIDVAKSVGHDDIRCIASRQPSEDDSAGAVSFHSIGAAHARGVASAFRKIQWDKVLTLILMIFFLCARHHALRTFKTRMDDPKNVDPQWNSYNRLLANVLYFSGMVLYIYCTTSNAGLVFPRPLTQLVQDCFRAFQRVHPISPSLIPMSHFAT